MHVLRDLKTEENVLNFSFRLFHIFILGPKYYKQFFVSIFADKRDLCFLTKSMKFISSVCWVPKGKSTTPTQLKLEKNELKRMFAEDNAKFNDSDEENEESDKEEDIDKKYNMDDYDDEGLGPLFFFFF